MWPFFLYLHRKRRVLDWMIAWNPAEVKDLAACFAPV
jgi:hypothetical protein